MNILELHEKKNWLYYLNFMPQAILKELHNGRSSNPEVQKYIDELPYNFPTDWINPEIFQMSEKKIHGIRVSTKTDHTDVLLDYLKARDYILDLYTVVMFKPLTVVPTKVFEGIVKSFNLYVDQATSKIYTHQTFLDVIDLDMRKKYGDEYMASVRRPSANKEDFLAYMTANHPNVRKNMIVMKSYSYDILGSGVSFDIEFPTVSLDFKNLMTHLEEIEEVKIACSPDAISFKTSFASVNSEKVYDPTVYCNYNHNDHSLSSILGYYGMEDEDKAMAMVRKLTIDAFTRIDYHKIIADKKAELEYWNEKTEALKRERQ